MRGTWPCNKAGLGARGRVPPAEMAVLAILWLLASCGERYASEGERVARAHCGACHAFPEPELLDRNTWEASVLPRMAPRLGVNPPSIYDDAAGDSNMSVLTVRVSREIWQKIVQYYLAWSPDTLPLQVLPAAPRLDPAHFAVSAFAPGLQSSAVITLLEADPAHRRVFAGEAGTNRLLIFDRDRMLVATRTLRSPPTDVIGRDDHVLVLESGILHPNDEPRGRLARYDYATGDSLDPGPVIIDSLFRPVFVEPFDVEGDDADGFLICEYGDNRGRLALYRSTGGGYERRVLHDGPGAIRFEIRDMTGDGHADVVALFAQGDERIVLFENDGRGGIDTEPRVLARFPPVYGSMHFALHDFNGDGHVDILYVNGDNFDFSRIRKPYHGVRILENDGRNHFAQRYFFPMYGAARAEAVDFDSDGDLDILATANFADADLHPERGIMFFENVGSYAFVPHAFTAAAGNQWNRMVIVDLDSDGRPDALIGAMDLANVASDQRGWSADTSAATRDAILFFRNETSNRSR